MQKSIWSDTTKLKEWQKLKGEIKTDVLVIGGGLCGILCTYFLKNAGVDCLLVEGNSIASGTTKNTTAKITSQHGLIYSELIKKKGLSVAKAYLSAHQSALAEYEKLCKKIDCDFEKRSSYVYSLDGQKKIEAEMRALNQIGFNATFTDDVELPIRIAGAVCFQNQAQFNPLKFISEVSKDLRIFENTFVREIMPQKAVTESAVIKCDKIIVTTHFPFINKHGSYFLKLYQNRSYISAFKNAQTLSGMYLDESESGLSFRSHNDILFIGGSNHRTGKRSPAWTPLDEFARKHYPKAEPVYHWAAQDCISLDRLPYIGLYSKQTPNMYVASGFNKWGMTSSMLSAMILTDMIKEKKNEFENLFSPQRSILSPQLAVNAFESTCNLITPTKKRCPHLGCALKWNKNEHTWDCPCHGSRFDENGKVIDNPATGDLN